MGFEDMLDRSGMNIAKEDEIAKGVINNLSWEDYNIKQPEKGKFAHQSCPKCNNVALMADYNTGDYFCESCKWSGNIKATKLDLKFNSTHQRRSWWSDVPIFEKMEEKLIEYYKIQKSTIEELGITTQKHFFKKYNRIMSSLVIPVKDVKGNKIIDYYFVPVNKNLELLDYSESINNSLLGLDRLKKKEDVDFKRDQIYFVNSILDYLSLSETEDDHDMNILCIPSNIDIVDLSNNEQWKFLIDNEESIFRFNKFMTVFPNDERNEKIKMELCRRLGYHLSSYALLDQYKDALEKINYEYVSISDILREGYEEKVRSVLETPEMFPIKGLHKLEEFSEGMDDIFHNGLTAGYSLGYKQLDPYLTIKEGQWTLVTGIPGHGKSSLMEAWLINLAHLHNFKIAIFSPENTPLDRFYVNMVQKASGKSYSKDENNKAPKISWEEHQYWKEWINDRFFSILPDEDISDDEDEFSLTSEVGSMTLPNILKLGAKAVFRHGIKILVIDPWTEVDHNRPNGLSELEYLSRSLSMIKRFARRYEVHVFVVAHPVKMLKDNSTGRFPIPTPYDIAGGAHWRNKGDNIVSVYRNVGMIDEDITDVYIQKIRFKECGRVGSYSIRADKVTGYYYDDIIQEKRIDIIQRLNSGGKGADVKAPSQEEMISSSMLLPNNHNVRILPEQFNKPDGLSKKITTIEEISMDIDF